MRFGRLGRRYGHAKKGSKKGQIPLKVLEKRARRLVTLIERRGGKV